MPKRSPSDVRLHLLGLKKLLAHGLELFPLKRWDAAREDGTLTGKTPRDKGWQVKDYSEFDWKWWLEEGGNVGIRLGERDIVIDVDMHGEHDGLAAYQRLQGAVGRLGGSGYPMVRTGSGGYHIFLRLAEPTRTKVQVAGYEGIDFKRVGGFVVAAGSIHPKTQRPYVGNDWWMHNFDIPSVPDTLLDIIKRPEGHERTGDGGEISNEDLARLLGVLHAQDYGGSDRYMDWIAMSAACYDATNGDGFEEWADWCRTDPAYASEGDENLLHHWDSFEAGREGGATYRTLLKAVVDAGHKDMVRLIGGDIRTPAAEDFDDWDGVEL